MYTLAVMCIAFTKHRPSRTPLLRTKSSTVWVMFTKPRRSGTSNQTCSVRLFISLSKAIHAARNNMHRNESRSRPVQARACGGKETLRIMVFDFLRGRWGGRRDLNPRQPDPQSGALTRLSYGHQPLAANVDFRGTRVKLGLSAACD